MEVLAESKNYVTFSDDGDPFWLVVFVDYVEPDLFFDGLQERRNLIDRGIEGLRLGHALEA